MLACNAFFLSVPSLALAHVPQHYLFLTADRKSEDWGLRSESCPLPLRFPTNLARASRGMSAAPCGVGADVSETSSKFARGIRNQSHPDHATTRGVHILPTSCLFRHGKLAPKARSKHSSRHLACGTSSDGLTVFCLISRCFAALEYIPVYLSRVVSAQVDLCTTALDY